MGVRAVLNRQALLLAYATVGYNAFEGVVPILVGLEAGSTALVGFGIDSFIEMSSALIVLWQFRRAVPQEQEELALRWIGVAFFALAAWIAVDAVQSLLQRERPAVSTIGIALACLSLLVMPALVVAKRRVAAELGSATVSADAMQSMLCMLLAAVLLAGLLLNALLGWWWADAAAALIIAAVAAQRSVSTRPPVVRQIGPAGPPKLFAPIRPGRKPRAAARGPRLTCDTQRPCARPAAVGCGA